MDPPELVRRCWRELLRRVAVRMGGRSVSRLLELLSSRLSDSIRVDYHSVLHEERSGLLVEMGWRS